MKNLILFFATFLSCANLFAWGGKGHAIIAEIAQNHLSEKAEDRIKMLFEGKNLVYYASWMDNLRELPEYNYTRTWHYLNVDPGLTYEKAEKEPQGDVYSQINFIVGELKKGGLSLKAEADYVRMIVHMVGDIHCPMHAGYKKDRGGNLRKIKWFGEETNLHSVWDSKLLESARSWSYKEWAENIDFADEQIRFEISSADTKKWLDEVLYLREDIYKNSPENANLSYSYINQFYDTLEKQLYKGGYRLAKVLNEIYN